MQRLATCHVQVPGLRDVGLRVLKVLSEGVQKEEGECSLTQTDKTTFFSMERPERNVFDRQCQIVLFEVPIIPRPPFLGAFRACAPKEG